MLKSVFRIWIHIFPIGIRIHYLRLNTDPDPGFWSVLRIRDVYPGSRIRLFPSRIRIVFIPDPGSASKNLSIFTQKIVSELKEIWSGLFIPDPAYRIRILTFYPSRIPDPDPQHWFWWPKIVNHLHLKKIFFDQKLQFTYFYASIKDACIAPVVWSFSSTTAQLYATHRKRE